MTIPQQTYAKWRDQTQHLIHDASSTHFFNVAGISLRIRLTGQHLIRPFLSAICHLEIPPCHAQYTIDVWDCAYTDAHFPRFECDINDVMLRGEVPKYCDADITFAYYAHARMVHLLNEKERYGVVALANASELPKFELACPFRGIFSWILRNNQMAMVHAAGLVDADENGCLIVGKSGAGKSTTAISCLLQGMGYIGDDLCALGIEDDRVNIYSIYSSGKTYRSEWEFIPDLSQMAENHQDLEYEKEIYFFGKTPYKTCRSAELKKIYLPSKSGIDESKPPIAALISKTLDSTRELLPDARFELLPLLSAAFRQGALQNLTLNADRICPLV